MADKEYIERGVLIENVKRVYCTDCNSYNGVRCKACGTGDTLDVIEDAPAVDVVEVVRCKDCVWWEARTCGSCIGRCENPRNGLVSEYSEGNDFCSYGERKEQT